ncbi:MAG: glycosyltransferase family 4 protein [Candidatus Scalindua sp.]
MKITIALTHAGSRNFNLARGLDKKGFLHKVYVPNYMGKVAPLLRLAGKSVNTMSMDQKKIRVNISMSFLLSHLPFKVTRLSSLCRRDTFARLENIDKWVAKSINKKDADIISMESHIALHTIRKAKELGFITVLDRTNSHIQHQEQIVSKEFAKLGLEFPLKKLYQNLIPKALQEYQEADYITVLSSYVLRTFLEKGIPREKLILVPSGVDTDLFKQVEKKDALFRIIYVGALGVKKGTHYLLDAFYSLGLPNSELWLIGNIENGFQPVLEKYQNMEKHKVFFVPNRDIHKYYSKGSVFVLPSLEEGLARVIMEAMACCLPVIVTVNTGGEDVVRDNIDGFVIPNQDIVALKEKIIYMYEHKEIRERMGQNGRQRILQGFIWDAYTERMINVYNKIIKTIKE